MIQKIYKNQKRKWMIYKIDLLELVKKMKDQNKRIEEFN